MTNQRSPIKIGLIAPGGFELRSIREQLARADMRAAREFHHLDEIGRHLKAGDFSLLILRFEQFTRNTIQQLLRLRSIEKDAGFITVVSKVEASLRFEARSLTRHILLEDPLEMKDVASSVEVLTSTYRSKGRMHPRSPRAEELAIYPGEGNFKNTGYFVDFAQMGARLVIDGKSGFTENQIVTVEYRSSTDRSRVHRIHSKVAWVRACKSNHTLLGIRFIASA
ncbi:MAG: hypothetical protein V4692_06290 [Bdellovibrionota bacterium]